MQAKGSYSQLVADFETSFGNPPGTPGGIKLPMYSFGVGKMQPWIQRELLTGSRNPAKPYAGDITVAGPIIVPVDAAAFPFWVKGLMGDPTTSGTGPYDHDFVVDEAIPSIVMDAKMTDNAGFTQYGEFVGCKVASIGMEIAASQADLRATINIEGKDGDFSSSPYDASPTPLDPVFFDRCKIEIKENNVVLAVATSLNLTLNANLQTDVYVVGGCSRYSLPEGKLTVEGNLTALFENDTLLRRALDAVETSIIVTFSNSGTEELVLTMQELFFEKDTPKIDGPQGILVNLPFSPFYEDGAAGSVVTVTASNGESGY